MGNRVDRKRRQQQKRQQKRRAVQRAQSGSPYQRIGRSGGPAACYINRAWKDSGQASIHLLRGAPGGGHAMAAFLVDLWCCGLKDAWGRLDIPRSEFMESMDRLRREIEMVDTDLETVCRLVVGGVRFARENGFRLPRNYKRWVAMLGELGNPDSADLSDFGIDGGLRYIGSMEDLSRRLVDSSAEEFLARPEVHYILGDGHFPEPDEAELAVDEASDLLTDRALGKARQWCFANGVVPHPRLREAVELTLEAVLQTESIGDDGGPGEATFAEAGENIERTLGLEQPHQAYVLREALAQFQAFMNHYGSPEEMIADLELDEPLEPDDRV